MSIKHNSFKEKDKDKEIPNFSSIKALLKEKNLNPKKMTDLKYLLSLTINPDINPFNFKILLIYLLKYLTPDTRPLFTDFFFQSCELGSLPIVKILLENNLDINSKNEFGETPLHIAVAKNDIELINLLIKYDPETNIMTYRDGLTVMNYAEILGDKNIIKIIKDLEKKNFNKKIKLEIQDYINNGMNEIEINDININKDNSSFISKNNLNYFDLIQNYNGEKISIVTDSDISSSIILNNLTINRNNNNLQNSKTDNKYLNTQTIVNESDYNEDNCPMKELNIILLNDLKSKKPKQSTTLTNINLQNSNSITNSSKKNHNNEPKLFSSSIKNKSITNNLSINPSYIQSLTTCHTTNNKDHNESPFIFTSFKSCNKKSKIVDFITEINLPKEYSNNLIDNGFDNIEVLISQTKKGIALTYENLRDIGIKKPGERFKILTHLEEISGNFDFFLDKKIYYNKSNSKSIKDGYFSINKFLENIDLNKFLNNFIENGIYNVELLYIQMGSKQPLNENILVNDFGINKTDANKIIIKLYENSRNYIKILKIKNKKNININDINNNYNIIGNIIMEEDNVSNIKSCDMCILF